MQAILDRLLSCLPGLRCAALPCRLMEVVAASLARWADTYLMLEEGGSPSLRAAFGAGSAGGTQATQVGRRGMRQVLSPQLPAMLRHSGLGLGPL